MVDPISNDALKRIERLNVYQEYQNSLDELEENSSSMQPSGKMDGKAVYPLENDPLMRKIFKNSLDN